MNNILSLRRHFSGIALLVIGLGAALTARAQASQPTPMPEDLFPDLKRILQAALQQSPQMIFKNIELAQSEANRATMRAQLLPNIGTGASYYTSDAAVSSNTSAKSRASGLSYSAAISQPVFRWGTLMAQYEASKIQLAITQRNYREAYRQLALSIRNQYVGLIARKITWRNAEATRARAEFNLSLEENKLQYGRISQSDILAPRLELEEARLRVDRAAEDLAVAKRSFGRLTGQPELSDASIPDQVPELPYDSAAATARANAYLNQGWEQAPAIITAREWVRVAELNYKLAKYRLYPMFSFGGGVSQSNSTSVDSGTVTQSGVVSQSISLSASWSIFDGGATKAAKISARANQRYYERLLQNQTDTLLDQVRGMEKQISFSHRAMLLAQTRYTQAESAAHQRKEELQQGLASQLTLDAALAVQESYALYLVNQRLDFLSRWSEFVSTVDSDPVLQNVPATLKSNVR